VPEGQSDELWRRRASSFGSSAAAYADHRPDYAVAAVEWVLEGARRDVADVLDLGAGTGALTGTLLDLGRRVLAVDPDPEMLAELRRRHPRAGALVAPAELIPVADDSVDAVVVATALHWFDLDRAGAEIGRVLRPGGVLGVFYNHTDETVDWVAELGRVSRTSASSEPTRDDDEARSPSVPGFSAWEERRFPHAHRRTAASLTATIGTHSHTRVVSPDEREQVLRGIRTFLDGQPETSAGEFDLPLTTVAARATPG
jgi:SAM-dependent methyltransferase